MNSLKNRNNNSIIDLYKILFSIFGPQGWWPADSKFEVIIGAILTQNTSWKNVEKSIKNLKSLGLLDFDKIIKMDKNELALAIKSSGFYNQKSDRIKTLLERIKEKYKSLENFLQEDPEKARNFLLSIKGIGKETADSIILYAMDKPYFVVDAYTKRFFKRFGIDMDDYETIRKNVENSLDHDLQKLKEFHALIVELSKNYCKKIPKCEICPLNDKCDKNV